MSTTGKVFALLNLLGLIGLTILAAMLYAKTKAWSYAAFLHELYLSGLPFDNQQTDAKGNPLSQNISDQTKTDIFAQAGGNPVVTQLDELARVRKKWQGTIDSISDDNEKTRELARILLVLARNQHERARLLAIRANLASADSIADLKKHLSESVRRALLLTSLPDPKLQRSFVEAYPEAVEVMRGDVSVPDKALPFRVEPKGPFIDALLRAFAKGKTGEEMVKALDAAAKGGGAEGGDKKQGEEAFLRAARGDRGKAYAKLFDECFVEALESIRTDLQTELNRYFDEPMKGTRVGEDSKPLSLEERRMTGASLLFNLVEAEPEYKTPAQPLDVPQYRRVLVVVGIRMFIRTLDRQAELLARMVEDEDREITADRDRFVTNHRDLLRVVQDRAEDLTMDRARLEDQNVKLEEAKKLAEAQQARVKQYEKFVADRRAETAARVDKLRKMTKELFAQRIIARDASASLQEQEETIRSKEAQLKKDTDRQP
jgi:hypothetical protein